MKWQDLVDITPEQFMQLSKEDLKARTQIMASAGNKRIKRAQEKGFSSPSIEAVLKKGKFSTKDKSFAQLRNEFIRAKQFLQSKTGTLGEFNKFKKKALTQLQKESGISITPEQFDTFWRAYEELRKNDPQIASKGFKYAVLGEIKDQLDENPDLSVGEIVSNMQDKLDEIYEANQERQTQAELNAAELGEWLDNLPKAPKSERSAKRESTRAANKAARTKARRKKKK